MLLEKRLRPGADVITGTILYKHDVLTRLAERLFEVCGIGLRVEVLFLALEEEAANNLVDQANYLVALALTGSLNDRRLALFRPGVAESSPLREGCLIAEQQIGVLASRKLQDLRPCAIQ